MRDLGDLEAAVMAQMWGRRQPATVREVHAVLAEDRSIAYTTVLTVLDNLHRKGFLHRAMSGRAWRYEPAVSRAQHTANLMHEALAAATDPTGALAQFVDRMSAEEAAALRALLSEPGPR